MTQHGIYGKVPYTVPAEAVVPLGDTHDRIQLHVLEAKGKIF
jgi:hypothetical protein